MALGTPSHARSPHGEVIGFNVSSNVGFGNGVFVVGSHPDVGAWKPLDALKLRFTAGNVWTGKVAVQSGTDLEYKFIARDTDAGPYCDSNNVVWPPGPNLQYSVPSQPDAPYSGKSILYHSGWTQAFCIYSADGVAFSNASMTQVSTGRHAAEFLYRIDGIGEEGEPLQFVMHNGEGLFDKPASGGVGGGQDYFTFFDVLFLQGGEVFNYRPPLAVSPSRVETTFVNSAWSPTIPSRDIRIYLPRGYDENPWKKYPVLYMHDGQNSFLPGGGFGTWAAEVTATAEIRNGRMRETIIVAVDNTSERNREYIPAGDDWGAGPGTGDLYAKFLVNNVIPTLDFNYRTLGDYENTLTIGSSFGGVISTYLGYATNRFGKIGPMSPAYWACPNFVNNVIDAGPGKDLRIYTDVGTGTGEPGCTSGDLSLYTNYMIVYDLLLEDDYVVNRDLVSIIDCGGQHCEAAWAERLPGAYQFLLSIWDEPNLLAQSEFPPEVQAVNGSNPEVSFTTLGGHRYRLDRSDEILNPTWHGVVTSDVSSLPWSTGALIDVTGSSTTAFYRVVSEVE